MAATIRADLSRIPSGSPKVPAEELAVLRHLHPNVLISGPIRAVDAVLSEIRPLLHRPLTSVQVTPTRRLRLPATSRNRTVIVRNVSALSRTEQQRLYDWLTQSSGTAQVVATAPASLFTMVEQGTFLDVLYYRLNTIYFDVPSH